MTQTLASKLVFPLFKVLWSTYITIKQKKLQIYKMLYIFKNPHPVSQPQNNNSMVDYKIFTTSASITKSLLSISSHALNT